MVAPEIETEQLVLVPWSAGYFDQFARLCADPEVMRFISRGRPCHGRSVGEIAARAHATWVEHGFRPWTGLLGLGLATEGARRAVLFAWEETPLERIISVTVPAQLASRR